MSKDSKKIIFNSFLSKLPYIFIGCLFLLFLLPNNLQAQNQQNQKDKHLKPKKEIKNIVHLKNGTVIVGSNLEQNRETISIDISDSTRFTFSVDEVHRIKLEKRNTQFSKYRTQKKGYYNVTQLGYLFGIEQSEWDGTYLNEGVSFETINGYYFNQYVGVGLGIQMNLLNIGWRNEAFTPIFLNVRGDLLKDRAVTPFYTADIGWARPTQRGDRINYFRNGKLYYNYGVGLKIHTNSRLNWLITFGQQSTQLTTIEDWPAGQWGESDWYRESKLQYNRLYLKLGLGF